MKGKISNGFEFEVDETVLDDMRLIDAIAEADEGDPMKVSTVVRLVLGVEQRDRLYDYLDKDGRAPVEAVMEAIGEIFQTMGDQGKN